VLSPEAFVKYEKLFNLAKISFNIVESNIQNRINEQERSMARTKNEKNIVGKYARYSEVRIKQVCLYLFKFTNFKIFSR
jgi:hypothetical protein